jgi:tetratricopeptide (TPR) repeat protein
MVFFHLDEARKYPLNLGTGEPYNPDTRIEDYIASICYRKSGNTQQADSLLNKIIDYTLTWQIKWNTSHYLGAIILRQQGREREAVQMLQKWVLKYPDNPTVQWAWSMWTNDTEKAAKITSSLRNSGEGTPWNPSGVDSNYKILIKLFQYHLMPDNL